MKQAQKLSAVAITAIVSLAAAGDQPKVTSDDSGTKDKVAILIIQPAGPVPRGVETEFTFDIQYTLETIEGGVLTIGFNTGSHGSKPNAFEEVESRVIKRGTDRIVVKAKVIPVDWGERGQFAVAVNIGPRREDSTWRPLAFKISSIPTAP
jgi:hypothetical protein